MAVAARQDECTYHVAVHLKMVMMASFMLCEFYHNF